MPGFDWWRWEPEEQANARAAQDFTDWATSRMRQADATAWQQGAQGMLDTLGQRLGEAGQAAQQFVQDSAQKLAQVRPPDPATLPLLNEIGTRISQAGEAWNSIGERSGRTELYRQGKEAEQRADPRALGWSPDVLGLGVQTGIRTAGDLAEGVTQAADVGLQSVGLGREQAGVPNPLATGQVGPVNLPLLTSIGQALGVQPEARIGAADLATLGANRLQNVSLAGQFLEHPAEIGAGLAAVAGGGALLGAAGRAAGKLAPVRKVGQAVETAYEAGQALGGRAPSSSVVSEPGGRFNTVGLASSALQGAGAGGYAAAQQEGATPEDIAKGALLGAGQRLALRALNDKFGPGQLARGLGQAAAERAGNAADSNLPPGAQALSGRPLAAGIVPPNVARALPGKTFNPDEIDSALWAAVERAGGKVTPDGIELNLARAQVPEQAGQAAQRGGVFYEAVPVGEGSSYAEKRAKGISEVGGEQRISGPTVFKNPLVTTGLVENLDEWQLGLPVRFPNELQRLVDRANYGPVEQRIQKLQAIVRDFGGDPYIVPTVVRTQVQEEVPSAIKENILGAAARRKGYDSIIGIAPERAPDEGYRIIEAMDLREAAYPGPGGEFTLRPDMQQGATGAAPGGSFNPTGLASSAIQGAGAGGYAASQQEGATPEDIAKGALLGAARGVLGKKLGQPSMATGIARALAQQAPKQGPTALDWLKSVGYSAMIGPATATVNVLGNASELLWQLPKSTLGNIARGRPEQAAVETRALFGSLAQAGLDALGAIRHGAPNPYQTLSGQVQNPVGKTIAQGLEAGGRLFTQAPDEFFGTIARQMGVAQEAGKIARGKGLTGAAWWQEVERIQQAVANGVTSAEAQQARDAAQAFAERMTFKGEMGQKGQATERFIRELGPLGHFFMPFFPTLYHMNARMLERTPFGLAGKSPDKLYDAAAGTMLFAGLTALAMGGEITGSGPDSKSKMNALRTQGWQQNSFRVGAYWVPNNVAGAFGPMLNLAGELGDALRYRKPDATTEDLVLNGIKRMGTVVTDQVYFRSITDFVDAWKDPERFLQSYAVSNLERLVPYAATVRAVANATDPLQRAPAPASQAGLLAGIVGSLQKDVPVVRQQLPPQTDVLGHAVPNPRAGLGALAPIRPGGQDSAILQEFAHLGIDLPRVGRKIGDTELSAAQYRQYDQLAQQTRAALAEQVIASPLYQRADDAGKTKLLTMAMGKAQSWAAQLVLPDATRTAGREIYAPQLGRDPARAADAYVRALEARDQIAALHGKKYSGVRPEQVDQVEQDRALLDGFQAVAGEQLGLQLWRARIGAQRAMRAQMARISPGYTSQVKAILRRSPDYALFFRGGGSALAEVPEGS